MNINTCGVLAVILIEFYEDRGRNHKEVLERGGGRVSDDWKPLTQTTKALTPRGRPAQKIITNS